MAENKEVQGLAVVPIPTGGDIYIVKDGDFRVVPGDPLGLATLGADGLLDVSQRPSAAGGAWGTITGTLANQTDLQAALDGKASTYTTGSLIAGSGVVLSGTLSNRLVGTGNVTITATGGGSSSVAWGAITGTLSSQADLQAALDAKSATGHTHAGADIVSGTVAVARLGSGTPSATTYLRGDSSWQALPATVVIWGDITGTLSNQTDLQTALTATQDAANLTTGLVGTARLGTGTANSTKFLRGDRTWQTALVSDTNYAKLNAANVFTLNQTAPNFISTSDSRLKYAVSSAPARQRLADLLRFVSYIYKENDEQALGLIAQEVEEVAPEYVYVFSDGYLGIDKAGLALEAVIGLAARVRELEERLA